jgi:protein-disulfide isomerase
MGRRQDRWARSPPSRAARHERGGFKSCLADKPVEDKVLQSRLEADKDLGVTSTPTLFINGVKYTGALAIEQISAVVDPLIGAN